MNREIQDVVHALRNARASDTAVTLLIGAGCSVKAGIPAASGFVERIKKKHPLAHERATEKTYPECMRQLSPGHRRDLIAGYVREAKINWAHVCIAALMREGYVDRVLTTNFDNLIVRACALLGEFPAVYDLAGLQMFKPADIPEKAIFHLHGQHTGFFLLNTPEEMEKQFEFLGRVFEEHGRRRTWIVVGYSGNDPVFKHLANVTQFDFELYWIGYKDAEPAEHVRSRLLRSDKYAFHVSGYDADSFFVTLAQELKIFPPSCVGDPFGYVEGILDSLTPFTMPGEAIEKDVMQDARNRIRNARDMERRHLATAAPTLQDGEGVDAEGTPVHSRILTEFMAGNYDAVIALASAGDSELTDEVADLIVWAHIGSGNNSLNEARNRVGNDADRLFASAGEKYQEALRIKPDKHEALYNWGNALSDQAKWKEREEADRLFALAGQKYEEALRIKADKHEALYNWGITLSDQAKRKEGEEADRLFALAGQKFEEVLRIKPDSHEALYNWGNALSGQAKGKEGGEADRLLTLARKKYEEALRVKPDDVDVLNNLAVLLYTRAVAEEHSDAVALFGEAENLLRRVESLQPGQGAYNLGCLFARKGDETQARHWLERSRDHGTLVSRSHMLQDPDLESVRETPWFQALLAEAKE